VKTDELIAHLTPSPARARLAAPATRFVGWAAGSLVVLAVGVAALGVRPDVRTVLAPDVVTSSAVAMVTGFVAASVALVLAVPGAARWRGLKLIPVLTLVGWGALQPLQARPLRAGDAPFHAACGIEIVALALVPGAALFVLLRRAAPLEPAWSAGLATLAAASLAAAVLPIVCPIDASAHVLASHVAPVVVVAGVGAAAGRRVLDWTRRLGVR
jgi:hypothetical protein